MMRKITISSLLALSCISICSAKNINLYDQPQNNAKIIGSIDSDAGVVPIFSASDGNWMKVGDPRNGNVGWVKSSDLSSVTTGFSFTQQVVNSGKGPQQYILKFSTPKPMSPEKTAALVKQIEAQQAEIQKNMQTLMQSTYGMWPWENFPFVMPIVIAPQEPQANTNNNVKK